MCELSVIGLGEVQWPGKREIVSGNYTTFYLGEENAEKYVTVVLRNDIVKYVTKVECYRDRLIFVKINAKPIF